MAIYVPAEKPFELCPPGAHVGTCYRVVDLGTQSSTYGPKHQVMIGWELQDELMESGKPFQLSRRYNYSSDKKSTLRVDLEGWLGRALTASDFGQFDLGDLLGTTCSLGVKHVTGADGRTFANVVSVMLAPKKTPKRLPLMSDGGAFSLSDEPFDRAAFDALPLWLREVIRRSPEYATATTIREPSTTATRLAAILSAASKPTPTLGEILDDEIPPL